MFSNFEKSYQVIPKNAYKKLFLKICVGYKQPALDEKSSKQL